MAVTEASSLKTPVQLRRAYPDMMVTVGTPIMVGAALKRYMLVEEAGVIGLLP